MGKNNIAPSQKIVLDKIEQAILFKEELLLSKQKLSIAISMFKDSIERYASYRDDYSYSFTELEYFDALAFRFIKTVELSIEFFKICELYLFSEESEILGDRLIKMQKIDLISDIKLWEEMRKLSSRFFHYASPREMKDIYANIAQEYWRELERLMSSINSIK